MAQPKLAVDRIGLPLRPRPPLSAIGARIAYAASLLVFIAVVVYIGRNGYVDTAGGEIGMIDALYYASVTVTTTGYGDISAVTTPTRLAALLLITPARIFFLILVVGTTVEVLTERSRQLILTQRWRQRVKDHYIVCGFGSTGQSATSALVAQGVPPASIVVVDSDGAVCAKAQEDGFTSVRGDASRVTVLHQAAIDRSKAVIVTPNRDDTAVLVTLTARELNPDAQIVAAGRVEENLHLLRQSGANAVIDSSAAVGRLLGIATETPSALQVLDDLLEVGSALELAEVPPVMGEGGVLRAPEEVVVIEVLREDDRLPFNAAGLGELRASDRLMVVRSSS